jgi:hypothetical protein
MTVHQLWVQSTEYNAVDDRLWLAASLPVGSAGPLGSVVGLRDPSDLVLTMIDGFHGTVSRGAAYIELAGSIYLLANDAPAPLTFSPSDPTGARIDLVIAQVQDEEAGGGASWPDISVHQGNPSQAPVPPQLLPGTLVLYTVRYNAGSTAPIVTREGGSILPVPGPRGLLARTLHPGAQDVVANINLMTTVVTLDSPRWMRVDVHLHAMQVSAANPNALASIYGNGVLGVRILAGPVVVNAPVIHDGSAFFAAPAGQFTAHLNSQSNVGALRLAANQSFLAITDVGPVL